MSACRLYLSDGGKRLSLSSNNLADFSSDLYPPARRVNSTGCLLDRCVFGRKRLFEFQSLVHWLFRHFCMACRMFRFRARRYFVNCVKRVALPLIMHLHGTSVVVLGFLLASLRRIFCFQTLIENLLFNHGHFLKFCIRLFIYFRCRLLFMVTLV